MCNLIKITINIHHSFPIRKHDAIFTVTLLIFSAQSVFDGAVSWISDVSNLGRIQILTIEFGCTVELYRGKIKKKKLKKMHYVISDSNFQGVFINCKCFPVLKFSAQDCIRQCD